MYLLITLYVVWLWGRVEHCANQSNKQAIHIYDAM